MLVACRLAGLSALDGHYAGIKWRATCGGRKAHCGLSRIMPSEPCASREPERRRSCNTPKRRPGDLTERMA
jgi:hypothetical protein